MKYTLCFYERSGKDLVEIRETAEGSKSAVEKFGRKVAKERGLRFVRAFEAEEG